MLHNFSLPPEIALDETLFREEILKTLGRKEEVFIRKTRQSIDARRGKISVNIEVEVSSLPFDSRFEAHLYPDVSKQPVVVVVGAGPAGLFAALRLISLGLKPIVVERGKDVRARRRDLAAINKAHLVDPHSNYCFGEGGAGTYSDGKLYTRSKKRGDIRRILEILVQHGATEDILVEAHPHIGTNKLPQVVAALRERILVSGGEVYFETFVTDFIIQNSEIQGVITQNNSEIQSKAVILATGHSARDIFQLLDSRGVAIEAKPFALGVRVEHPQKFIDSVQYNRSERGLLPAAAYSLVEQTRFKGIERGVFSFCMCPGGFIVPAATAPGELVVNGMSPSRRDSRYANSGIVVAVNPLDWRAAEGVFGAMNFQARVEQKAAATTGFSQAAPSQLIDDFLRKKGSTQSNETSYQPGLLPCDLRDILPDTIAEPLRMGLEIFNKRIKGYGSNIGQMIGIESRTSSPVRIPRRSDTLEHPTHARLFPCGEGAGYAGGIISAAIDGERCAEQVAKLYG